MYQPLPNDATVPVRGLSLKDALDLIPRYNGHNISLSQFIDGCNEAKSILPAHLEGELAKLIRIKFSGEALSSARGVTFGNLREVSDYLEGIFGSPKTYHECIGDLAKIKQKTGEAVITFLNRLREIEKEIATAARREERIVDEDGFRINLEADCVKFFFAGTSLGNTSANGHPPYSPKSA